MATSTMTPAAADAARAAGAALPPRRTLRTRLTRADTKVSPYLYISPFFLIFVVFGLFPLCYTLWVSLTGWNLVDANSHHFVGLANYRRLLHDPYFWNALRNTVSIWLLSTVPQLIAALALAHVLNRALRARTFFRMGVLAPNIASVAATTIIFSQLFGRDFGVINWLLHFVGVHPIDWQAGRLSGQLAISTMVAWQWTGYNALIYLAGMQSIPTELYEAASLDGANSFQQFRRITIPSLRPVIIFTVIISTIGGMQLFTQPLLFTAQPGSVTGGSGREYQTLVLYLYEQAWRNLRFGYGAAIAWALFLVIVLAAAVNYLVTRRIRSSA